MEGGNKQLTITRAKSEKPMIYLKHHFIESDLILRRGGHINRSNLPLYQFVTDNYDNLDQFYLGYQCKLTQHQDGFFYLISKGGLIPTRLLPLACIHLGMFIALKMRDPEITRSSGRIDLEGLLRSIEVSVPRDTLQKVYAPKQREASVDTKITEEIQKALKNLARLNFVEIKGQIIKPLESINRFAELARHDNSPDELARIVLMERGVVFREPVDEDDSEDDDERTD